MWVALNDLPSISWNKLKLVLLASAPFVVSSGICYYYYYYYSKSDSKQNDNKNKVFDPIEAEFLKSIKLKNEGNELFRQKNYDEALRLYTEAIFLCPKNKIKELSTFYQNRAACYEHLKKYEDVIKDSTKAIEYEKKYVKAYLRRGKANEILENFDDASFDYYMASGASSFENSDHIKLLSECLEKYAFKRAKEVINKREKHTFQKYMFINLLNKFSKDPMKKRAGEILKDYDATMQRLLNEDNEDDLSVDDLLLKGTIELYLGKHEEGRKKMLHLIETADLDYKVNALLKLAENYLLSSKFEQTEKYLHEALKLDPNNPDIYYCRSQYNFVNQKFAEIIEDLTKAIKLDPNFVAAIGQKLYIQYQMSIMANNFVGKNQILKEFDSKVEEFLNCNEILILYCQVLLSQDETKKAEKTINKAIQNNPDDPTLLVYKAIIYIEEGNLDETKKLLDEALKLDPRCSFAYEMLSDLCAKLGNIGEAIDYLEKAINNSTTFDDIKNLIVKQKTLALQLKSQHT